MDDKQIPPKNENYSWGKVLANAFSGCIYAFKNERNFKVHFVISLIVLFLAWWLEISFNQFLFLLVGIFFGLTVEMGNTVFEKTVDLITEKYHPAAKIAKDTAAGMMLIASVGLAILGILILLPPLWQKLFGLS